MSIFTDYRQEEHEELLQRLTDIIQPENSESNQAKMKIVKSAKK